MEAELIARAGRLIREGKLVAFPTETVYGLGANALDVNAVGKIYQVKNRPATSPLIVHVDSVEMARSIVESWPASAEELATAYWPGPLTIVLRKRASIPDLVTAALPTVGVRMPRHPVALALIRAAQVPIAAPSANRFSQLSPTTAEHVVESLGDAVDLVLDGGPCEVGIESTVVSLCGAEPVVLRPGSINLGTVADEVQRGPHPSPGMHQRHYSPRTPLYLTPQTRGRGAYLYLFQPVEADSVLLMPADPGEYAAILYRTLHSLDAQGFDWIAVELPPDWPEWAAVRDRLTRAAAR